MNSVSSLLDSSEEDEEGEAEEGRSFVEHLKYETSVDNQSTVITCNDDKKYKVIVYVLYIGMHFLLYNRMCFWFCGNVAPCCVIFNRSITVMAAMAKMKHKHKKVRCN